MRTWLSLLIATMCACSPAPAPLEPVATEGPSAAPTTTVVVPTTTTSTVPPPPEDPTLGDPETLATLLRAAEEAIRSPATAPGHLAGWSAIQQRAYRELVVRPEWREEVRARLPEELEDALDANLTAGEALRALTRPQAELPDWQILAPPPAEVLLDHYRSAEAQFGVPWEYLAAIHLVETRMGRIRGISPAGAQGPMQFLPETWWAYGEGDIEDPGDAIRAAARYLVAHGAPGDMPAALYAYNRSQRYVVAIEAYASVMRADPRAYLGYYHWRVYYRLATGDVLLTEGYGR